MERAQLSAARHKKHWSLDEAAAEIGIDRSTLLRWEKGRTSPQPMHIRKLCEVYGKSAHELDLEDEPPPVHHIQGDIGDNEVIAEFSRQDLTMRLLQIAWNWSARTARYQDLQRLIVLEVEGSDMSDDLISRRDALRRLALFPVEFCSLSALIPVLSRPTEEILTSCAAGITACWELRKGHDLAFAGEVIERYLPTLQALSQQGSSHNRTEAAHLLTQALLLKSILARHLAGSAQALHYAKQAAMIAHQAHDSVLEIVVARNVATVYDSMQDVRPWRDAAERTVMLVTNASHVPPAIASTAYIGLANALSYTGEKQDALSALKKAKALFFAQDPGATLPIFADYGWANVLLNEGHVYYHLGDPAPSIAALDQLQEERAANATWKAQAYTEQTLAELMHPSRDMEYAIDRWIKGAQIARQLSSQQRRRESLSALVAMQSAWPGERRIAELREHIVR